MAKAMKHGRPLLAVGLLFILAGLLWLISGRNIAIGLMNMGIGMVFIMIGGSVMRKADSIGPAPTPAPGSAPAHGSAPGPVPGSDTPPKTWSINGEKRPVGPAGWARLTNIALPILLDAMIIATCGVSTLDVERRSPAVRLHQPEHDAAHLPGRP